MLAQLESKIFDLQSQIQATQSQITDYKNNTSYVDFYYVCHLCGKNNAKNNKCSTQDRKHRYRNTLRATYFFTKTAELAQAQATLATLQNELKTTQEQYQQEKENRKNRTTMLYQAFLLPIPSTKIQSTQKVLKSIESLQDFLKQDFLTRQYF